MSTFTVSQIVPDSPMTKDPQRYDEADVMSGLRAVLRYSEALAVGDHYLAVTYADCPDVTGGIRVSTWTFRVAIQEQRRTATVQTPGETRTVVTREIA